MKKEVVLAIVIGFGIGLVATFGLYSARKTIGNSFEIYSPVPESDGKEASNFSGDLTLSISSPLDESISKDPITTVSGTTLPLTWIVVIGEKEEKIIKSDDNGLFETEVNLISGENEIEITALSEAGGTTKKTLTVVYSTVEI